MKNFISSLALVILVGYVAFRINDPLEIFDTGVNFVLTMSKNVAVLDRIWAFLVTPMTFLQDNFLGKGFMADLLSGRGVWKYFIDLIVKVTS